MPGHTGIPPALANGSSVYVYVDEEDQGGDGTAYMVGFYLSPPPPPPPPPPHSSHPLPSQVHNIIVRYSETTPASYVSQLDPSFTKVIATRAVLWDCSPPAHSQPLGRNRWHAATALRGVVLFCVLCSQFMYVCTFVAESCQ